MILRIIPFLLCLTCITASAQVWPGFETGQYSGISSANLRPGGMAWTPFKADATVVGVHLFSQTKNLFTNEKALDMITSGGFKGLAGFSQLDVSRTVAMANLQGPSLLYSVNPKLSVAFAWNMRYLWSSRFSEPQLVKLFDDETPTLDLDGSGETATTLFNGWNEFGFGAGGQVFQKNSHHLAAGGFVKMTFGSGNLNFNFDNLEVQSSGNTVEHLSFRMHALMSEQVYTLVDDGRLNLFDRVGVGFDLGAEYRFQFYRALGDTSHSNKEKFTVRAGFSLTDIGVTRYKSALEYTNVDVSGDDISLERFRSAPTLRATVDTLREIFDIDTSTTQDYNVTLPMSLRLYADFRIKKNFYVYNEFHFLFARMMAQDIEKGVIFRYNVTPRYEDHRYGVYLPVTFANFVPANVGLSLRWKPFIIGSSNIFTFWIYDERGKMLDLYLTIKVPILHKNQRAEAHRKKPGKD